MTNYRPLKPGQNRASFFSQTNAAYGLAGCSNTGFRNVLVVWRHSRLFTNAVTDYTHAMATTSILIVDDEKNILTSLKRALELEAFEVDVAGSAKIAQEKFRLREFDLALLDIRLPDGDGLDLLQQFKRESPPLQCIVMSGHGGLEAAVEATKRGAFTFLSKPIGIEQLLVSIKNALGQTLLESENAELRANAFLDNSFLGTSAETEKLREQIALVANSEATVLILGERGTGKELIAQAMHGGSKRKQGPYEKLNCAAVPSELIESELFGHEAGAFTGATKARRGKFERAHQGTLFLDEVADMPTQMQAKLLRVLQEGEIERVGGQKTTTVDVRVVAATNKDLTSTVENGSFRADLYDRLNVVPIMVPPLRVRSGDIELLARHFLLAACRKHDRRKKTFSKAALKRLRDYNFPGNVRELQNVVERLVILSVDSEINERDVASALPGVTSSSGTLQFDPKRSLKAHLEDFERQIIAAALDFHNNHVTNTAQGLELERSHLYKKMKSLGIRD